MPYNQILEDSTGSEHIIEIKNLNKSFDGTKVLKDITFYIRNNEFITLLGPSGCGKSTTLRIIAGFETADSGIVNFEGKDLKSVPANKRNINTVFQRYALFPHLNVFNNVAFGLKIKSLEMISCDFSCIIGEKVVSLHPNCNSVRDKPVSSSMIHHARERASSSG